MRILSICGQNIASLADRFEIDFTAEPLRSAGLFAITGETGAGKSSILDPLCLALYGECPRLTMGGSGDEVADAGGDPIRARDPRAVLRRGAAQGWAQATLDARQRLQTERTGEIGGQLVADAASRAALSGLEAEISTAKATLEVWQAVNMAVGSKNGDRFARLAQSITLDVLVDRANHHLGDLKPRYRRKRILSKHPKSMLVGIKRRSHLGAIGPSPMAEVVSLQKTGPDQKSPSARLLDGGDLARFVRSFSRRA